MKYIINKINSLVPSLSEFRNFILAIFKKWIFLIFLALDFVSLIIQIIYPQFSLSRIYYIGFALIGFIWASFQVYRDMQVHYEKLVPKTAKVDPHSELAVSFVEGNEYAYSIADPYLDEIGYIERMQKTDGISCHYDEKGVFFINNEAYYVMGKGKLVINIRIENSGDLPLDILTIRSGNELNLDHLKIYDDGIFLDDKNIRFPFHMKTGEIYILKAKCRVTSGLISTTAQFVAEFRSLPKSFSQVVTFDTIDSKGTRKTYTHKMAISSRPLLDLYINQLRQYYQEDYLRIAGFNLAGE